MIVTIPGTFQMVKSAGLMKNCRVESSGERSEDGLMRDFPDWFTLTPKPLGSQDVDKVEAFVAMAVSSRETNSVDVRYLLHRLLFMA